jgi:hypothetical protein
VTTGEFLQQLRRQDIRAWVDGDQLRVNGPQRALTPELQAELAVRKVEIREFLRAAALRRSSLVPIQPGGARPVFFGVPADGDVFCYAQLSRQLGPDQPFYAFEAPGIDGVRPPLTSIQELAAHHLADLRAFQPSGPYFIGGFCLGGIVAFELARQLRAENQEVALLALFESPSPNGFKFLHRRTTYLRRRRDEILERLRQLSSQSWSERLAYGRARLARTLGHCEPIAIEPPRRWRREHRERVFWTTTAAAHSYVRDVRRYPGRIVLFLGGPELKRRRGFLRQLDWAHVAGDGLEVNVGLDGCSDYPRILEDPVHVRALADRLKPYIERPIHASPCEPAALAQREPRSAV